MKETESSISALSTLYRIVREGLEGAARDLARIEAEGGLGYDPRPRIGQPQQTENQGSKNNR